MFGATEKVPNTKERKLRTLGYRKDRSASAPRRSNTKFSVSVKQLKEGVSQRQLQVERDDSTNNVDDVDDVDVDPKVFSPLHVLGTDEGSLMVVVMVMVKGSTPAAFSVSCEGWVL